MKPALALTLFSTLATTAAAQVVVLDQPHNGSGTIFRSAWLDPDGSAWDQYIWDGFTLPAATAITEIRWRGGFDPAYAGAGGPVVGFTVELWSSILGGSQPDIGSVFAPNPLRHYVATGNCAQTQAGTFGGVPLYDYRFALPAAFQAAAATKYWVRIHAWQHGIPDWGFAAATGGDGSYFRKIAEYQYQSAPGDAAFSILSSSAASFTISAAVAPAGAGTINGAGAYPANTTASLTAISNPGFGFANWTENSVIVSNASTYTFAVTANRSLVANFVPAYTITTAASPAIGGWTTGDGTYNAGAGVTVTATANAGYTFTAWTEFGTPVSTSATYTFSAAADRTLVAEFATAGSTVLFDFDNAPVHTSLPIDLTVGSVTAHLSATAAGFSIQQANTMGFTPAGFAGLCIYPNSVFAADLLISYSAPLTDFSIMYAPQELGCDTSARMRVTAYLDGVSVGTNTATAPAPGTWPTGTLSIAVPGGFNSVVVHYDARPPTCQDWGPIFLADNMLVTLACAPATAAQQPISDATCTIGGSSFFASASGALPFVYQWQAELDPGIWTDLADGDLVHNSVVLATVAGATSDWLQFGGLTNFPADRPMLNLRCVLSNSCGSATTDVATLTVWPTATGDANQDGIIDGRDIQAFANYLAGGWSSMAGWCASDLDSDGWVDVSEVPLLSQLLLGG